MVVVTRVPGSGRALMVAVQRLLETLADIAAAELRTRPLPPLYESGVRYREEENAGTGLEHFADPWTVFEAGFGDCDDLVLWRIAELRMCGVAATCQVVRKGSRFHVRVRWPDGFVEDPSLVLLR